MPLRNTKSRLPMREIDAIQGTNVPIKFLTESEDIGRDGGDNPMIIEADDGAFERRLRRREDRERARARRRNKGANVKEERNEEDDWRFHGRKKFVYRPRRTGIRAMDPTAFLPVQPWDQVRPSLVTIISTKSAAGPMMPSLVGAEAFGNGDAEQGMAMGHSSALMPTTIPYGFQLVRQLHHSRPTLKSTLYIPAASSTEQFVTFDTHYVHVWRGPTRIKKFPLTAASVIKAMGPAGGKGSSKLPVSAFEPREEGMGACGIQRLEYVDSKDEIIAGEVGSVRVWKIKREIIHHQDTYTLIQKMEIPTMDPEEWVAFVKWERVLDRIIAACESNIYIYDYETGAPMETMKQVHEMSITSCVFYEPAEYLITAGKCGKVKVWNSQAFLIHEFESHYNSVTSLLLLEQVCEAAPGTLPVVVSSSLDGTIRMWNFETGTCIYRLDTGSEVLGMGVMKRDTLFHFSRHDVQIWNVNRVCKNFSFLNARPLLLARYDRGGLGPPRLLVGSLDGSVKLVSPVNGDVLMTGFPVIKDFGMTDLIYDREQEKIYSRNANADIIVYDVSINPMKITSIWKSSRFTECITCLVGVEFLGEDEWECPYVDDEDYDFVAAKVPSRAHLFSQDFYLLGGTENGQIMSLNYHTEGRQEPIVQAHTATINVMRWDHLNHKILTGAKDWTIKVWNVTPLAQCGVGNSRKSDPSVTIKLECVAVLNIEEGFGVVCPDFRMCLNPSAQTVGFAWAGGLILSSYTKDCGFIAAYMFIYEVITALVRARAVMEEKAGLVTYIASLREYNIWATADREGSVKIWDGDCSVIREIQFNEPISSVLFSNHRGDLIVGLANQLAVIWMQDYLPIGVMRQAVARRFKDDPIELPKIFDSNSDFWQHLYDEEKALFGVVNRWHIPKNMDILKQNKINDWAMVFKPTEVPSDETRRNRRIFLASEASAFNRSSAYEPRAHEMNVNAFRMEAFWETDESDSSSDEDEHSRMIGDDLVMLHRIASETALLPVGVMRPQSPTEGWTEDSTAKISRVQNATKAKEHTPHIQVAKINQRRPADPKVMMEVAKPAYLYQTTTAEEIERRRGRMKKRLMENPFLVMPNSVVKIITKDIKPKEAPHATAPQSAVPRVREPVENTKGQHDRPPVAQVAKKVRAGPPIIEPPPVVPKYIVPANRARGNKKTAAIPEPEDILPVRDYDINRRESNFDHPPSRDTYSIIQDAILDDEVDENDASSSGEVFIIRNEEEEVVVKPKERAPLPKTKKSTFLGKKRGAQPDPVKTKREMKALPPHVVSMPNKRFMNNMKNRRGQNRGQAPYANGDGIGSRTGSDSMGERSGMEGSDDEHWGEHYEEGVGYVPNSDMGGGGGEGRGGRNLRAARHMGGVDEGEEYEDEDVELNDLMFADKDEASAYAWSLIARKRRPTIQMDALRMVKDKFWFPKSNESVTLSNIIPTLVKIIRQGLWSEVCEASKALLFLYKTFKDDLRNVMEDIIRPQIDALHNPNWQVRAQMLKNLPAYEIFSSELYAGVIAALKDPNEVVRQCAVEALANLDVHTKEKLKLVMIRLGMIKDMSGFSADDILNGMLEDIKRRELARAAEACTHVDFWRSKLEEIPHPSHRCNSYPDHLAGRFFPPDFHPPHPQSAPSRSPWNLVANAYRNGHIKENQVNGRFLAPPSPSPHPSAYRADTPPTPTLAPRNARNASASYLLPPTPPLPPSSIEPWESRSRQGGGGSSPRPAIAFPGHSHRATHNAARHPAAAKRRAVTARQTRSPCVNLYPAWSITDGPRTPTPSAFARSLLGQGMDAVVADTAVIVATMREERARKEQQPSIARLRSACRPLTAGRRIIGPG
ncbi:WD repeat-containing protein 87, partial [Irineochytrium annulatum]